MAAPVRPRKNSASVVALKAGDLLITRGTVGRLSLIWHQCAAGKRQPLRMDFRLMSRPRPPSNKSGVGNNRGPVATPAGHFVATTHREVVAAAFRISALGAPHSKEPPGSRAFPAACLHSTPPRFRLLTFEELHKTRGSDHRLFMTWLAGESPHSLCDAASQGPGLRHATDRPLLSAALC
jgi:hypothetical protein